MIISKVSRHDLASLNQELPAHAEPQQELRGAGKDGLKLKPQGQPRGFGLGRSAHRAQAWTKFARVIYNTFADSNKSHDPDAARLAARIKADLRDACGNPGRALRLRHVRFAADFAGRVQNSSAAQALQRWEVRGAGDAGASPGPAPRRGDLDRLQQSFVRIHTAPRKVLAPEAQVMLQWCRQTLEEEPV